MRKLSFTAAIAAAALGLAGCGDGDTQNNAAGGEENGAAAAGEAGEGNGAAGQTAAAGSWAKGARIVEENGVTYRIDPDGTRVQLGENEGRIVVENGVRYRVDQGGSRVRIDERGLDVDVDLPDVDIPDVDVDAGINSKGNPDIDVSTNGSDASPDR